jgi:hypothetical protein
MPDSFRCGTTADASLLFKLWACQYMLFETVLLYRACSILRKPSIGFILILFIVVYEGLCLTLFSAYSKIPILMTPVFSGKNFADSLLQIVPLLVIYTGLFGASLLMRTDEI